MQRKNIKMNKYYYRIYGMIIVSNIEMPLLPQVPCSSEDGTVELIIEFGRIKNNGISIMSKSDDCILININNYANYTLYFRQNRITCLASDFEAFFSTLFNIPFSIFFILKGKILLHACGLSVSNKVFGLAGDKGVGKSTLSNLLNGENFRFFSDDTMLICSDNTVKRAHNLIKITDETISALELNDILSVKNATGKSYRYIEEDVDDIKKIISCIMQIKRSEDNIVKIVKIDSILAKRQMLIHNIVGIDYFGKQMFKSLMSMDISINISYYSLYVPNSLDELINKKQEIINSIKELVV